MNSKFCDIPFRSRSIDSDFICKDGEVEWGGFLQGSDHSNNYGNGTLPSPDIDFALVRQWLSGWHLNADQYPMKTLVATTPSLEYWTNLGSQLLSQFKSEAENENLFVAPFYVAAAWKTRNGVYLSPSSPVLLTPNSTVPLVSTDGDINSPELDFKIAAAVCSLFFKMRAPELLRDWVGIIESMEIFVSDPRQSYDTFHAFLPYKHITTDNYCESLDPDTGEIAKRRVCTETLTLAWKANCDFSGGSENGTGDTIYHRFASVPLSEVDIKGEWSELIPAHHISSGIENGLSYNELLTGGYGKKSEPMVIEGTGEEISVMTRPLKLSSGVAFKRIYRAYLRGNFDPTKVKFSIYGSRDMLKWWCISQREGSSVLAFPGTPFRFFRACITGKLEKGESLQGISVEYLLL